MKKLIPFPFVFIFISSLCLSQYERSYIKITAVDAVGNRDSVMLTVYDDATIGIDTSLGEKNIYGESYKDLDLRVIQRKDSNGYFIDEYGDRRAYWKSRHGGSYYMRSSVENIDLKEDIRELNAGWEIYYNNNYFIEVKAVNSPVIILVNCEQFCTQGDWLNIECQTESLGDNHENLRKRKEYIESYDTLYTGVSNNFSLSIWCRHVGGVSGDEIKTPNISYDFLSGEDKIIIARNEDLPEIFEIYNILGVKVFSMTLKAALEEANISGLQNGIYFLKYKDMATKIVKY